MSNNTNNSTPSAVKAQHTVETKRSGFDIRDYIGRVDGLLEETGERDKYYCPVCDSHNLGIDPNTGKFSCFDNGCDTKEITIAVLKAAGEYRGNGQGKGHNYTATRQTKKQPKQPVAPVQLPEGDYKLLKLQGGVDIPKAVTTRIDCIPSGILGDFLKLKKDESGQSEDKLFQQSELIEVFQLTDYPYSKTLKVTRYEVPTPHRVKGKVKTIRPLYLDLTCNRHKWALGKGKEQWQAYRIDECIEAAKQVTEGITVILLQEGEGCVDIARSLGIASFTFQGGSWGDKDTQVTFQRLKDEVGEKFVVAFLHDPDDAGKKKLEKIEKTCNSLQIAVLPISPDNFGVTIPKNGDIKELVAAMGNEKFIERLEQEIHAAVERKNMEWKDYVSQVMDRKSESTSDSGSNSIRQQRIRAKADKVNLSPRELLASKHAIFNGQLRFNEMTLEVEYLGENVDLDHAEQWLADVLDAEWGSKTASEIAYLAKKQKYHPVKEYLEQVYRKHSDIDVSILDDLANRYFGTNEPLYNVYLKKTLVAAVKRVYEPGCQHDTACVLQGGQGIGKSRFWQKLAKHSHWYDDSVVTGGTDKDDKLKLRSSWIIDLSEIEGVFRKNDITSLRNLITSPSDKIRPPYGRKITDFPRTSIFVGTVNPSQFLNDPEGNRRFWVIPVERDYIPIETLEHEVDKLWAAAVAVYRKGEKYNTRLNSQEKLAQKQLNANHTTEDAWTVVVEMFLNTLNPAKTTVPEILVKLGIEVRNQGAKERSRVRNILSQLGWKETKNAVSYKGSRQRIWYKPDQTDLCVSQNQAVSAPNPYIATTLPVTDEKTSDTDNLALCRDCVGIVSDSNPYTASDSPSLTQLTQSKTINNKIDNYAQHPQLNIGSKESDINCTELPLVHDVKTENNINTKNDCVDCVTTPPNDTQTLASKELQPDTIPTQSPTQSPTQTPSNRKLMSEPDLYAIPVNTNVLIRDEKSKDWLEGTVKGHETTVDGQFSYLMVEVQGKIYKAFSPEQIQVILDDAFDGMEYIGRQFGCEPNTNHNHECSNNNEIVSDCENDDLDEDWLGDDIDEDWLGDDESDF
ncbi:virulence-associated E family protein [Calothrix sp. UHCC 0171]|uniref:virulence-associated E family protein n=1 Tax=Calothrix sp. UHCC 0171 TaxID=3110245 RepID=UPI002B1FF092|nr:virulence-associated E family protein [Calothrix sp. UHCC 0171]MEA5574053.1 virulence-associated E family protein [Calothrix sp. UHCC 0171]